MHKRAPFLITVFMLGITFLACNEAADSSKQNPVPQAPQPPAPTCAEERCTDRPAALQCTENREGKYCVRYELEYARHCDCLRWNAPDAGAADASPE